VPLSIGRGTLDDVTWFERLLDSRFGWVVPGGAPFKLGRRDGARRNLSGSFLIWGVYGERMYDRGRRITMTEQHTS